MAHLTGWLMPMPGPGLAADLAAADTRLADCALSRATDQAVASRTAAIASRVSGPALAAHVTAAMRAGLRGRHYLCSREEPQWLAPAYRWALVLDSLRGYHREHPGAGPHPSTTGWVAAYGRAIAGSSCAEQLATVQRWDDEARRDRQVRIIAFGTGAPSPIEQAAGARVSDPGWEQRLAAALAEFTDCRWALDQLKPPAEAALP
jgi:hypothetical protein